MGAFSRSLSSTYFETDGIPLPRLKRETEDSHSQHPASVSIFNRRSAFDDHTTPLSLEARDGGYYSEHEKTPTLVFFVLSAFPTSRRLMHAEHRHDVSASFLHTLTRVEHEKTPENTGVFSCSAPFLHP